MANELHPWSRMAAEGRKSFSYFTMYLELGQNRSVVKVQEKCGKNLSFLHRLSSKFSWLSRAIEYDQHVAELTSKQIAARRAAAQVKQADRAGVLSDTALVGARRLVNRLQADENAELTPDQITSMFGTAARVEATALGFGKEGVQVNVTTNVNPVPRAAITPELALKAALAFVASNTDDLELERACCREISKIVHGQVNVQEAN